MGDRDESRTKAWVENWATLGPELEAIRRRELRQMTYQQRIKLIDTLLQIGGRFGKPRTTSGLAEQQRLFQKARQ